MALLQTSQPGSVGLEVTTGPGGGLFVSLHTAHGYLSIVLTSYEAHRASQIFNSLLMSPREPIAPPRGNQASSDLPPLPHSGGGPPSHT